VVADSHPGEETNTPMSKAPKKKKQQEHRLLGWGTNALLFLVNFLLMYSIWAMAAPGVAGLARLFPCWLVAFVLTWIIACMTGITVRLLLTLAFMGLLIFVSLPRG